MILFVREVSQGRELYDPTMLKKQSLFRFLRGLVCPLALVLVWDLAHRFGLADPSMLPSPYTTFVEIVTLIGSGSILPDLGMTVLRMAVALAMATVVGVALGLVVGAVKSLYDIALPLMDFVRSTPVTILYPVIVLLLGVSHASKIAMVFLGCVFVIALNTAYGVMQASQTRMQMARVYEASRWQMFRWVLFYDSLPQTMIGLRVSLSYALIIEILCEMFMGSQYGLGQRVTEAFTTYAIAEMYALVLIVGALGFLMNRGFVAFERKIVPWSTSEQR